MMCGGMPPPSPPATSSGAAGIRVLTIYSCRATTCSSITRSMLPGFGEAIQRIVAARNSSFRVP